MVLWAAQTAAASAARSVRRIEQSFKKGLNNVRDTVEEEIRAKEDQPKLCRRETRPTHEDRRQFS
jgi:Sec-independent protein translocase protein TatA